MSDMHEKDKHPSGDKPILKKEMSRRQFLTYTLGGTGGFMVALPLIPMLRFAVDPLLQTKGEGDWVKVVEESQITTEPKEFTFSKLQVDGWYSSTPDFAAWIAKDESGKVFALSPICKHLGCTIQWAGSEVKEDPNQYHCPCHGARYTKDGKDLKVASVPLDQYDVDIKNGFVYLGTVMPNKRVK
ncbi:MAG: ubiquinol-cytochrome c reductase iron-sulfur subunit [Paenibacillaceae bacterium]